MRHLDTIYEIEVISLYFLRELQFFKTLVRHRLLEHGIALTIRIVIVKHTDLFCYRTKNDLNSSVKIPNYYNKGNRKLAILHCRLRNRSSDRHADLFYNNLSDNVLCDCQQKIEDAEHFIFRCNRYEHERVNMFHKTRQFHPLSVSDALNGKRNLSADENSVLFEAIQTYIKDTRRFNDNQC